MGEKSDLHRDYVLELENELRELEKREESSTRRMQMLVYPAMIAFIILASYGFYLVQSLTTDVGRMAVSIVTIADSVDHNMKVISTSTVQMSEKMTSLVNSTETMTGSVGSMSHAVGSMNQNVDVMTDATSNLALSTNNMQQDMWSLNQNISTPLSMFNKFIPWSNNSNGRFRGSSGPGAVRPPVYYQPYQAQQPVQLQAAPQQAPVAANN